MLSLSNKETDLTQCLQKKFESCCKRRLEEAIESLEADIDRMQSDCRSRLTITLIEDLVFNRRLAPDMHNGQGQAERMFTSLPGMAKVSESRDGGSIYKEVNPVSNRI